MRRENSNTATIAAVVIGISVLAGMMMFGIRKRQNVPTQTKEEYIKKATGDDMKLLFEKYSNDTTSIEKMSNSDKLLLYGLYKQATIGDAPEAKPSWVDIRAGYKYDSWSNFRGMSQQFAMIYYIQTYTELQDKYFNFAGSFDFERPSLGFGLKPSQPVEEKEEDVSSSPEAKLRKAAASKNFEEMKTLIETGANFGHADKNGETALHFCADRGMVDGVTYLLELGANPNSTDNDGISVLQVAVIAGHFDVCKILLEKGADPDHQDADGDSPRTCAEEEHDENIKGLFTQTALYIKKPI